MANKIFSNINVFEKYLDDNGYKSIYSGGESIIFKNNDTIIKYLWTSVSSCDDKILVQKKLNNANQSTFIGFDDYYILDDKVIAGSHKYIDGKALDDRLDRVDFELLSNLLSVCINDIKKISNLNIGINDPLPFNVFYNNDGIYYIDTTRFYNFSNFSEDTYINNLAIFMNLFMKSYFNNNDKNKILEPIINQKNIRDLYRNYESWPMFLKEIKISYSNYFDSEVNNLNDVHEKMCKNL